MNGIREQRRRIQNAFRQTGPNLVVQAKIRRVMEECFQKTGCVPAVELIAQELGIGWALVNQCYRTIIDELPDREAVESAYADFLTEACLGQEKVPTWRLLQLAARAKLTASRVGKAIQIEPAVVAKRAAELEIKLSETEAPGLALPRRLTEGALRALHGTQVSTTIAARVAGVSYPTFADKLKRIMIDLPKRETPRGQEQEEISISQQENEVLAAIKEVCQLEPLDDVMMIAARSLMTSAGHDPDELVPGAYGLTDDPDGKLHCDEIQMVAGQAIGLIHAYRREAARIRQVLDAVLQAGNEKIGIDKIKAAA